MIPRPRVKIRIFSNAIVGNLELDINGFISETMEIIDIKYCVKPETKDYAAHYTALIIYRQV